MTEPVRAGRRKFFDLARPSRQHLLGYILIAPAVLMVAAIIVWPLVLAIDLSFQQVKIPRLGGASRPFSLSNYTWLFSSPEFWLSCWVTLKLVVVVTAGSVAVGLQAHEY